MKASFPPSFYAPSQLYQLQRTSGVISTSFLGGAMRVWVAVRGCTNKYPSLAQEGAGAVHQGD